MKLTPKEYQKHWRAKNPDYHKNYKKTWAEKNPNYYVSYRGNIKNRAKSLIAAAANRCKKHNSSVSITEEWLIQKLVEGTCEISKLPFDFSNPKDTKNNLYAPSLDRIDSANRDYTPENTRVVIWGVNRLHGDDTLESMIPIMEALLKHLK